MLQRVPCVLLRVLGNTRYLLVAMRLKGESGGKSFLAATHSGWRGKQFIRKVSLWFNKSPKLKMLFAFILVFHRCLFFVSREEKKNARQKNEERRRKKINPLCEIIQLFSRNFSDCMKRKLLCLLLRYSFWGDKSLLRLIMKKKILPWNWWEKKRENPAEISSVNLKS